MNVEESFSAASQPPLSKQIPLICASILAADHANLKLEVEKLVESGVDVVHVDVMDGHFVPNISFGPATVKSLRKAFPHLILDCHLMVEQPQKWVESYVNAGASSVTFHIESLMGEEADESEAKGSGITDNHLLHNLIRQTKAMGASCGLAISPDTPIEKMFRWATQADFILVMTVRPGFGGQQLMQEALQKIRTLRNAFPHISIQADGGITQENISQVAAAGANLIVSGSAITASRNQPETVRSMKTLLKAAFDPNKA